MKYVVLKTGGKQYKVSENDVICIENLHAKKDEEVILDKILLYVSDEVLKIGKPELNGFSVKAKILGEKKDKKIQVSKYKSKVRYRRVTGHRQLLTEVKIEKILLEDKDLKKSKKT